MFEIEQSYDHCRVTGYADGSDWIVIAGRQNVTASGIAGDYAWFQDNRAALHIFHAPERRRVTVLNIAEPEDARAARVSAGRSGEQLFALVRL